MSRNWKKSHHSNLLKALNIPNVSDVIDKQSVSLFQPIFQTDSPCRDLNVELLSRYVMYHKTTPGTLLHRITQIGHSPISLAFGNKTVHVLKPEDTDNGLVDSMKHLLCHTNFLKPYSDEHVLLTLLTKAFWCIKHLCIIMFYVNVSFLQIGGFNK